MRILRSGRGRSALAIFCFIACVSFSALGAQETGADAVAAQDESAISLEAPAAGDAPARAEPRVGAVSNIWLLVRMVLVLALVCGAVYGIVYLMKKSTRFMAVNDPYLKSVASLPVAPGRTVQVVTLGKKGYLIGVSDSSINLIAEVEDSELVDAMNLEADGKGQATGDFASVIARLLPARLRGGGEAHGRTDGASQRAAPRAAQNVPQGATRGAERMGHRDADEPLANAADLIRRQRERLSGEGDGR